MTLTLSFAIGLSSFSCRCPKLFLQGTKLPLATWNTTKFPGALNSRTFSDGHGHKAQPRKAASFTHIQFLVPTGTIYLMRWERELGDVLSVCSVYLQVTSRNDLYWDPVEKFKRWEKFLGFLSETLSRQLNALILKHKCKGIFRIIASLRATSSTHHYELYLQPQNTRVCTAEGGTGGNLNVRVSVPTWRAAIM